MTLYAIALFLHVVGALLLVTALTGEGIALFHLRQATTREELQTWEGVALLGRVFGPVSIALILLPGLYMMFASWGWVPWIAVGLFGLLLIAAIGASTGIRFGLLVRSAAAGSSVSHDVRTRLRAAIFVVSWFTRVSIALGVVFLMTSKPQLVPALLAIVIAAAVGFATGALVARRTVGRTGSNEVRAIE
jgi:hypothetical protein